MIKSRILKNRTFFIAIIVLLTIVGGLYSTYAINVYMEKTTSTNYDMALNFDVSNTLNNQMTVAAGKSKIFDIDVTNNNAGSIKYGVVYQMVSPTTKPSNVTVAQYAGSKSGATGVIDANTKKSVTVIIKNDSSSTVKISFSVVSGFVNGGSLPIPSGKHLLEDFYDPVYGSGMLVTSEVLDFYTEDTRNEGNLEFTEAKMSMVTLGAGTYKLEVWGAQGGNYGSSYFGGKGGYSYGNLNLTESTLIYVYVGGQNNTSNYDTSASPQTAFNGGGSATYSEYEGDYTYALAGGGGTDIRIGQDSLYARVIVAGGGSGATSWFNGHYGGGEISGGSSSSFQATQTSAGSKGSFGQGGNQTTTNYKYISSGGGGGWYGGGGGDYTDGSYTVSHNSGGGSGYVYTSTTASYYPSDCLLNSSYYLTDAATIAGNQSFTDFNGSTVTGHAGTGAARISWSSGYIKYFIPRVLGLTDISIDEGGTANLTTGVTYECETGSSGCTYVGPENVNLSTLPAGEHTINYTIIGSSGRRYLYPRKVIVTEDYTPEQLLVKLGLTVTSGTPNFNNTSCSSGCNDTLAGIYSAEDDLGTSYYFRGSVTNNYVKFGKNESNQDMYWRIIRINGDGTVRMIYDGTQAHDNGTSSTNRYVTTKAFNSTYNDNTYVGYMYGDTGQSTHALTHSNKYNSTIKAYLEGTSANNYTDGWYYKNIVATGYNDYVADAIYCNDRSLASGTGIGTTTTYYGARGRLYTNKTPTLKCDLDNNTTKRDSFTVGTNLGNGLLEYPVGLITADEVAYAGGVYTTNNKSYYLYMGSYYWTMSPFGFGSGGAIGFYVYSTGYLLYDFVHSTHGVRPVISLKSNAIIDGTGSKDNPFVVKK